MNQNQYFRSKNFMIFRTNETQSNKGDIESEKRAACRIGPTLRGPQKLPQNC